MSDTPKTDDVDTNESRTWDEIVRSGEIAESARETFLKIKGIRKEYPQKALSWQKREMEEKIRAEHDDWWQKNKARFNVGKTEMMKETRRLHDKNRAELEKNRAELEKNELL